MRRTVSRAQGIRYITRLDCAQCAGWHAGLGSHPVERIDDEQKELLGKNLILDEINNLWTETSDRLLSRSNRVIRKWIAGKSHNFVLKPRCWSEHRGQVDGLSSAASVRVIRTASEHVHQSRWIPVERRTSVRAIDRTTDRCTEITTDLGYAREWEPAMEHRMTADA